MVFFHVKKKKLLINSGDLLQNAYYLPDISLMFYLIFTTILDIIIIMSSITSMRKPSAREVK